MIFENFPNEKYDIIVIDPPWNYKNPFKCWNQQAKKWPYKTLSLDNIQSLPIESLCHDSTYIFLWTTQKYIFECKNIVEKWGLNYVFCMTWEKTFGISSGVPLKGFRLNSEFIIVATKHKINPISKKGQKLILTSFSAPNIGHSIKPDIFYKNIEHLGEKRLDLFARKSREGWDVWGDEL